MHGFLTILAVVIIGLINQTGKGFDHHSDAFNEGYTRGWCRAISEGKKRYIYPHADNKFSPDFKCDVLGMSLIFTK